jgi:hypothetical protein
MGEKLRIMIANLVNSVIHLYEETEETAQKFYNRKVSKNLYLFPPLPQNFCRISHLVQLFSLKQHQQSTTLFTQTSPAKYNSFCSKLQKNLRGLLGGSGKIYYFCTGKFGKVLSDYTKSNFVVQNHGNLPRHY